MVHVGVVIDDLQQLTVFVCFLFVFLDKTHYSSMAGQG